MLLQGNAVFIIMAGGVILLVDNATVMLRQVVVHYTLWNNEVLGLMLSCKYGLEHTTSIASFCQFMLRLSGINDKKVCLWQACT